MSIRFDHSSEAIAGLHLLASKQGGRVRTKEDDVGDTPASRIDAQDLVKEIALDANGTNSGTATPYIYPSSYQSHSNLQPDKTELCVAPSLKGRVTTGSMDAVSSSEENDYKKSIELDEHEGNTNGKRRQIGNQDINTAPKSRDTTTYRLLRTGLPRATTNSQNLNLDMNTKGISANGKKFEDSSSAPNTYPKVNKGSLNLFKSLPCAHAIAIKCVVKQLLDKLTSGSVDSDDTPSAFDNAKITEKMTAAINLIKSPTCISNCKQVVSGISAIKVRHHIASRTLICIILLMTCNYVIQLRIRNDQLETGISSLQIALRDQPKIPKLHADVTVGVPPAAFQENQIINVHFHEFNTFQTNRGQGVKSPAFSCFNHEWRVEMYPGGHDEALDGNTSIYLRHLSEGPVSIDFEFVLNDAGIKRFFRVKRDTLSRKFDRESSSLWGHADFTKHSFLSNPGNLSHGTLSIELRMKLVENKSLVNFIPENPFSKNMMGLFLDEQSADVRFELSNDDNSLKVQYYAHCLILKACAPALARQCEGSNKLSPIAIPDVEPPVFLQLLLYVYGGDISPDWKNDAKKFIYAADKYGLFDLKLRAEAWYVAYCNLTVINVADELLYADAMNCPLLREAAINFISKNVKEVMKSESFENVLKAKPASRDILLAVASAGQGSDAGVIDDDSVATVNNLRVALYEKGLEIHGSRESLTSRLKLKR